MQKEEIFLELLGLVMGDGCILYYPKHRVYGIEIAGNTEQLSYYVFLADYLEDQFGKRPRLDTNRTNSDKGIRLVLYGKEIAEKFMQIGIPAKDKTNTVIIPQAYVTWKKARYIIRGIFEADGSLYFSKSRKIKYPSYPRMEIKTNSRSLAQQISDILKGEGYKVILRELKNKNRDIYSIYLSGPYNLEKWYTEIGFPSERNETKYRLWKRFKYSLPNLTLAERKEYLMQA